MRVAILQPFYLPYGGVFELVRLADTFVLYDDVQFVAQNWQCRNRIKTANGVQWLSVPVHRDHGQLIRNTKINNARPWGRKHWRSIAQAYARAPHLQLLEHALRPLLEGTWTSLCELNIETFRTLCHMVGVRSEFVRSSDMQLPGGGHERVLAYCRELGATRYVSGPAGRAYLREGEFASSGIAVEYLDFRHPRYDQLHGDFVSHLSVIDMLALLGEDTGKVLAGCGMPVPATEFQEQAT